jgi:hypothetical protein
MRIWDFSRSAFGICTAAAMLAGCGGSQSPIGAPGAIPHDNSARGPKDVGLRIVLAVAALLLFCSFTGSRAFASSCVSTANAMSAVALARYKEHDLASAARLQQQAAAGLEQCLETKVSERTISSNQRVGEMWLYLGEYELDAGDVETARTAILRAKRVFTTLRSSGSLRGTALDEVLIDSHQADSDLARQSYGHYQLHGNREATAADFDAAILDWSRAATFDMDPDKICRGEDQRVQINAARAAKSEMLAEHLSKPKAAAWFENHFMHLWITNKCNRIVVY